MPIPPEEYANAYFEGFQNWALISASVAAPKLPMALPLASGVMLRVVTPVCTGLNSASFMSLPSSAYAVMHTAMAAIALYILESVMNY